VEFRQCIIKLVLEGMDARLRVRTSAQFLGAIRNWVRQADREPGRRQHGLTTVEQDEVRRLRRQYRATRSVTPRGFFRGPRGSTLSDFFECRGCPRCRSGKEAFFPKESLGSEY